MKDLTVRQVAAISGLTVPTLHLHDEIGLFAPGQYRGEQADLYLSDPDFVTRQETTASGFAVRLSDAMKAHIARETSA